MAIKKWRLFAPYSLALIVVAAITAMGVLAQPFLGPENLALLYLAAVILVALYLHRGPAILANLVSVVGQAFVFARLEGVPALLDVDHLITLGGLAGVGFMTSFVAARSRERAEAETRLAEKARQVELLQATEKLQSALLHSISHDLRTPLVTMTVAFSNLERPDEHLDAATRRTLARTGREQAERLNHLVGELLDMSRIEAGALKVHKEPGDLEEAIGVALDRLAPLEASKLVGEELVDERPVAVQTPPDLPLVPIDLSLLIQALTNVMENAVKYSPEGSDIEIGARVSGNEALIEIADRGIGVSAEDRVHMFEKFYRGQRLAGTGGSGLGLAVARGIVEAHGGRIWAEERSGGGTIVTMALPLDPAETA